MEQHGGTTHPILRSSEHCVQDGNQLTHTGYQRHFWSFRLQAGTHKTFYHRIKAGCHKRTNFASESVPSSGIFANSAETVMVPATFDTAQALANTGSGLVQAVTLLLDVVNTVSGGRVLATGNADVKGTTLNNAGTLPGCGAAGELPHIPATAVPCWEPRAWR